MLGKHYLFYQVACFTLFLPRLVMAEPVAANNCGIIADRYPDLPAKIAQVLIVYPEFEGNYQILSCQKEHITRRFKSLQTYPVSIGKNGVVAADQKREGDLKTPEGLYSLGTAFGISAIRLNFSYRKLTFADKFIDDPNSVQYNSWVSGYTAAKSYEPMLKYYRYGIVINYNMTPIKKGKGSAIFIHNWNNPFEPTSGCIAMAESNLLTILKTLDKNSYPHILILK